MHECMVGFLRGNLLDKANIKDKLNSEAYNWNKHSEAMNWLNSIDGKNMKMKTDYKASDFLDMRKSGSVTIFNNCPYCGIKIDWKTIKQSLLAPLCRDCADYNGICPHDGSKC